MQLVRQTE